MRSGFAVSAVGLMSPNVSGTRKRLKFHLQQPDLNRGRQKTLVTHTCLQLSPTPVLSALQGIRLQEAQELLPRVSLKTRPLDRLLMSATVLPRWCRQAQAIDLRVPLADTISHGHFRSLRLVPWSMQRLCHLDGPWVWAVKPEPRRGT